ncbi:MAG: MerR family transcriptional regulator [Pseudomonadota bacterium]
MAKGQNAFRTISEASDEIGAPQHVLRFWETKFPFVTPLKRAGGRRFYRPEDIVILKAVRRLLHDEGLTIKGVQRLHKDQGLKTLTAYGETGKVRFETPAADAPVAETARQTAASPLAGGGSVRLQQVLADLEGARARLEAVLAR